MKASDASAMVGERIQFANLTDKELVIEAERQLSWSCQPSPGNVHAPLGEVLFCNAVIPVMVARLTKRPVRRLVGVPNDDRAIDLALLRTEGTDGDTQVAVEERRRAVAVMRRQLDGLSDKDLAATARFHFAGSRGALAGRGYDPRLAQLILPEMIRRLTERRAKARS